MITLYFKKSRSKNYPQAVKLAREFDTYEIGYVSKVEVLLKEVIEKWAFFNKLFWMVTDWKGTYLVHDGMRYFSNNDKKLIFYSLQQAHLNWMNITEHRLVQSYKVYRQSAKLEDIDTEAMTDEEINQILDAYNAIKKKIN